MKPRIGAIILAAGQSRRMGQPKMLLPWGGSTVLQTVIHTLQSAGIRDLLVITGGAHQQVIGLIKNPVQTGFNPNYQNGGMLSSIQLGLSKLNHSADAALICLGDQPQMEPGSVRAVCESFATQQAQLVVPSYQRKRGHPWLVARPLWEEILALASPQTTRDFLNRHSDSIHYVNLDSPSILTDLDTPEDYHMQKPR